MTSKNSTSVSKKFVATAGALMAIAPTTNVDADLVYVDDRSVVGSVFAGDGSSVGWDVDGFGGDDFELQIRSGSAYDSMQTGTAFTYNHYFYGAVNLASRTANGAQMNGRGVVATSGGTSASPLFSSVNVGPTLAGYAWGASNAVRSAVRFVSSSFRSNFSSTSTSYGRLGDDFVSFDFGSNFIGFRFDRNGATHYGWAELEFNETEFAITRWAYESTPDTQLRVGSVPEPSSLALLGLGAVGLLTLRRRN